MQETEDKLDQEEDEIFAGKMGKVEIVGWSIFTIGMLAILLHSKLNLPIEYYGWVCVVVGSLLGAYGVSKRLAKSGNT